MILMSFLGMVAALMSGLAGLYLTARSLSPEVRLIERRLAGPKPTGPEMMVRRRKAARANTLAPGKGGKLEQLVDRWLPKLRQRLEAARAPLTPSQVVLGSLGLFGTMFLTLTMVAVPLMLAFALAVWGGIASPILLISFLANRRRKMFVQQLPQAVDLIARSLQAGHPVTTAMGVAANQMGDPIGPEFSIVISEMNAGLDRDAALQNLLLRFPIAELRMFTASLEVTRETGGNVAEVLLSLSDSMRAKAQLRKKVAAISAEGRLSFWVVSALPLVVAGILSLISPNYYGEVKSDPLFWQMMMIPPVLWLAGALMMWRMINFRI
ncbi:type II secretion system F family protein [Phenylobacterium sp.]|jgi:tight adherence protein B|uniref:type II secretion system F family protein n=1 Tax=Phenylobacterium sp. TaxID=1871053 RepID=UPI002F941A18